MSELPKFVLCGCCYHYHPVDFWGDCRDNDNRFTEEELEEKYGLESIGWIEIDETGDNET